MPDADTRREHGAERTGGGAGMTAQISLRPRTPLD